MAGDCLSSWKADVDTTITVKYLLWLNSKLVKAVINSENLDAEQTLAKNVHLG